MADYRTWLPRILGLIIGLAIVPGSLILLAFISDRHPTLGEVLFALWLGYGVIVGVLIFARPWIERFYRWLDRKEAQGQAKLWVEQWTREHAGMPMEEMKEQLSHDIDRWVREHAHLYRK